MTRNFFSLIAASIIFTNPSSAQTSDPFAFSGAMMHVSHERQQDGCFTGKVYNKAPGAFTVAFNFSLLKNTTHEEIFVRVVRSPGTVFNIRPIDSKQPVSYSSSNTWIMVGELNPRNPQIEFLYRLPVSTAKESPVRISYQQLKKNEPKENRKKSGVAFLLAKSDTLYAPRKGLVTRIPGKFNITPTSPTYTSNTIQIEHGDGTYATFGGGLGNFHILVRDGDMVYPGSPLAVVRADIAAENASIGLNISYRTAEINFHSMKGSKPGSPFTEVRTIYIDPVFALPDGNGRIVETGGRYRAVETPAIVTAEMSKREIKVMQKKK